MKLNKKKKLTLEERMFDIVFWIFLAVLPPLAAGVTLYFSYQ